jgi:hypothetical protein
MLINEILCVSFHYSKADVPMEKNEKCAGQKAAEADRCGVNIFATSGVNVLL